MKETVEILNTTCNEMLKGRILFSSIPDMDGLRRMYYVGYNNCRG